MSFYWIYNLPNWLMFVLVSAAIMAIAFLSVIFTQKFARKLMGQYSEANDMVGLYYSAIGVFYGLALGLIAVGVWETFGSISEQTDREAASLGAMYRIVSNYPDPIKSQLQVQFKDYTRYIIDEAWPLQQQGKVAKAEVPKIIAIQKNLSAFEPTTQGQIALHSTALQKFDELTQLGRMRIQSVTTGLPPALWWVVAIGAGLNIFVMCFLVFDNIRAHVLLSTTVSAMMALLICLTIAMDNPFRGEFSVSADSFRGVYDSLMK